MTGDEITKVLAADGIASEPGERWTQIERWQYHAVSSHGRVACLPRQIVYYRTQHGRRVTVVKDRKAQLMRPFDRPGQSLGHMVVWLKHYGVQEAFDIGRGVLSHFGKPCPVGVCAVVHKDKDYKNCRLDNLEWGKPLDRDAAVARRQNMAREAAMVLKPDATLDDLARVLQVGSRLAYSVAAEMRRLVGWSGLHSPRIGKIAEMYRQQVQQQKAA